MAINFELEKRIEEKTRRLGTKADSYLKEFFDIYFEYPEIKNMDMFLVESERMQSASDSTMKQFKEVLLVFGIIDFNEKILTPKINSAEAYIQILTSNIKNIIKNIETFSSPYKNTLKLIYNFIYSQGVSVLSEDGWDISEFNNKSLDRRTSELKSVYINFDNELKQIVKKEFISFIESCGFEFSENKKFQNYLKNELKENFYDSHEIEKKKEKLQTEVKNIFDLINDVLDPSKEIEIPFYQREYVWGPELIENFIKEIKSEKNEMLNIGNILISTKSNASGHLLNYSIVDGQQRLTSIILMFNYLAKELSAINLDKYNINSELQTKINKCKNSSMINYLINKSNPIYIVELKEVLDLSINEEIKFKKNSSCIKVNYSIIASNIKELSEKSKVYLFNKLSYIFSTVTFDKISDEIELFISTNSSRKPLSNYDLIKSFIISKIPESEDTSTLNKINNEMNEITNLLKFNNNWSEKAEDIFFNLYLNYRDVIYFDETSNVKDLFKRFKDAFDHRIHNSGNVLSLLKEIKSILESYRIIKEIDTDNEIYIKDFILSLSSGLRATSIYDLFLIYLVEKTKVIEDKNEKNMLLNEFRKVLIIIEQFEINWKLFSFAGDSLSNAFKTLFINFYETFNDQIEEKEYKGIFLAFKNLIKEKEIGFISKVFEKTSNKTPTDYIQNENIKKQQIALKILNRVAFNLFNNGIEFNVNSKSYYSHNTPTIEHIYPKKSSKWMSDDKTNAVKLESLLEEIGNKFIFDKNENSSAGNKTFKEKLEHYKGYNELKLDKTLSFERNKKIFDIWKKDKWTSEDINIRSQFIIEELLKIWE